MKKLRGLGIFLRTPPTTAGLQPAKLVQNPGKHMDIVNLVDSIGEAPAAAFFGLITGTVFDVAAQRSRFCLRHDA